MLVSARSTEEIVEALIDNWIRTSSLRRVAIVSAVDERFLMYTEIAAELAGHSEVTEQNVQPALKQNNLASSDSSHTRVAAETHPLSRQQS